MTSGWRQPDVRLTSGNLLRRQTSIWVNFSRLVSKDIYWGLQAGNIKQSEPFMLEILLWKKNYNLIIHETNFYFFFSFGNMLEIITNELLIHETWLSWTSSRLLQFAGIFKFQRIWKTVSCPGWCTLLVCLHVFESIKGCLVWKYFWQNLVTFPWK